MRIFITFGDDKFKKARKLSAKMAKFRGGFDKVIEYTPEDISPTFKREHEDIFSIKRGYGLWLWKPYIIWKTLNEVANDGDLVFYADAGSFFIRNVKHIEKEMGDSDILVSAVPLREWQFTKVDVFDFFNCEDDQFLNTAQIQGTFFFVRKSLSSVNFVREWLDLCTIIDLLHPDNIKTGRLNPVGFVGHREDQSILSVLCKSKSIKPHQDPTQFAKYPEQYIGPGYDVADTGYIGKQEYPVCIVLHRSPHAKFVSCIKPLILILLPRCIGLRLIKNGMKNKLY